MDNILIIVGSARNGNSLYIANQLKNQLNQENCTISQISNMRIEYCSGCLDCDETHKCSIEDDMDKLIPVVIKSDVIIMISPARWSLLSGDLKVFIDRLNPIATTGEMIGKKFLCVAVGQSKKDDNSIEQTLNSMGFFCESAEMQMLGKFAVYECLNENDAENKKGIKELISEIANSIKS